MTGAIERRPRRRAQPGLLPLLFCASVAWTAGNSLATSAVASSIEAELAYHRGVVAFGENDLDTAKRHFEVALAENREEASTLQYLGIIASQQDQPDLAIELFERAVAADPEDAEIRFTLGVALLQRDRAEEAGLEFDRVLAVEPDNARAEFYAGVADYRRQKFPETVSHMQAAQSLDPALRLQSRYYTGLAEVFMGNLDASTSAFADAASLSPSDPLALSASVLGKKIQPESRGWGIDLGSGIEFDSNPTFVGSDVQIIESNSMLVSPKREEDVTGIFALDTYYDLGDWEQITLRLGYSAFLSVHGKANEVDQLTNVGWVDLGWMFGDFRAGVRVDYASTQLDLSKSYRDMTRFAPSLTYTNGDWGVTQFLYQFHNFQYRNSTGGQPNFDPDGELHIVGMSQFIYLPAPLTYARFGLAYEHSTTDGTEFDYDGVELTAGAEIELPALMRAAVLLEYFHRQYDNRTLVIAPVTGPKRKDDIVALKLDWTIPVAETMEFALRGTFTWNDSNIGDYDYNRHVVGSYVTYTF